MMSEKQVQKKKLNYQSMDVKDVYQLIDLVNQGLDYSQFLSIKNEGSFTFNEWSHYLRMSERTMQRYKREKRSFDSIHSERILQIALVYKLGMDVFGDNDNFDTWLNIENIALGKIKPKELLNNSFGIQLLRDELIRIEHGVLA